jgi:hypothetical protein
MTRQFRHDLADGLVPLTCNGPGRSKNVIVYGKSRAHHGSPMYCIMHHCIMHQNPMGVPRYAGARLPWTAPRWTVIHIAAERLRQKVLNYPLLHAFQLQRAGLTSP